MPGYLIGEEGPLAGAVFSFEEGTEWTLGRDPDEAAIILEDPMVSRKHAICRQTSEGFTLENLSSVNPITQNGKVVEDVVLLREGDILQIGSTFFRFTEIKPEEEKEEKLELGMEETPDLSSFHMDIPSDVRWMIKVISGPNTGAEFGMQKSSTYIIGKDPAICDIVFQDLSVSRQHARLIIDDENRAFIEDLGSKNGVLINGRQIFERTEISSQDLLALGTTSFLVIDRHEVRETIISPAPLPVSKEEPEAATAAPTEAAVLPSKDWKEMVISKNTLFIAGGCAIVFIAIIALLFGLFNATPVVVHEKNQVEMIREAIKGYPEIQFSFNSSNGKLFLTGNVLSQVERQELLYLIRTNPFVQAIDDNVVVDELVWQNINALLVANPHWQGVSLYSSSPGKFVLRGYLQTPDQLAALTDYMNQNFPYLDKLENQVVVESNLASQIQGLLIEKGFGGVTFQMANGDVVFQGMVDSAHSSDFNALLNLVKSFMGIRSIKNFVILSSVDSSRIDLSSQYKVTGYSRKDGSQNSVVINGKILTMGDLLDGMQVSGIQSNVIFLEKDGLKFKINYNLQ